MLHFALLVSPTFRRRGAEGNLGMDAFMVLLLTTGTILGEAASLYVIAADAPDQDWAWRAALVSLLVFPMVVT